MRVLTSEERVYVVTIDDVVVEIKPLTPGRIDRVKKKYTKTRLEKGERVEETDWLSVNAELFVYCVVDWRGLEDEEGRPLECDNRNKALVAKLNPGFASKVIDKAASIEDLVNKEELKNSSGGPDGPLATQ